MAPIISAPCAPSHRLEEWFRNQSGGLLWTLAQGRRVRPRSQFPGLCADGERL